MSEQLVAGVRQVIAQGECPITLEEYAHQGPHKPLFLPACGHTFSEAGIRKLVAASVAARVEVKCPLCQALQPDLQEGRPCPPNWSLISALPEPSAEAAAERPAHRHERWYDYGSDDDAHAAEQLGGAEAGAAQVQAQAQEQPWEAASHYTAVAQVRKRLFTGTSAARLYAHARRYTWRSLHTRCWSAPCSPRRSGAIVHATSTCTSR